MIYLANALFNDKIALEIYNNLLEKNLEVYTPNTDIKYEGREININAFEQLRKRNPTNPYIIELKKEIIKELEANLIKSSTIIVCNNIDEVFKDQTMLEIAIAWYLKNEIYSYNNIHSINRELCSAIGIISLKSDLSNLKLEGGDKKDKIIEELKTKPGRKQKLTIQD